MKTKSLLTSPSNVLPLHLMQTGFLPWTKIPATTVHWQRQQCHIDTKKARCIKRDNQNSIKISTNLALFDKITIKLGLWFFCHEPRPLQPLCLGKGSSAILTWRKQGASRETIKIPSKAHFWRPRSDLHHHHSILSMSDWTWKPKVTRSDHKNRPWEVGPAHSLLD